MDGYKDALSKLDLFEKDIEIKSTAITQISNFIFNLIAHLPENNCSSPSSEDRITLDQNIEKLRALLQSFKNISKDAIDSFKAKLESWNKTFLRLDNQNNYLTQKIATLTQKQSYSIINDVIQDNRRQLLRLYSIIETLKSDKEILTNQNTQLKVELYKKYYPNNFEENHQNKKNRKNNQSIESFLESECQPSIDDSFQIKLDKQLPIFPQSPVLKPIQYLNTLQNPSEQLVNYFPSQKKKQNFLNRLGIKII